jgi:hypothetical protein
MKRQLIVILLLLMVALPAFAQDAMTEKPFVSSSQTVQFTAQVVAVDRENYTVTLRGPQGGERTLELGEEARRLDEVEVGDTVMGEILQSIEIEVVAVENAQAGSGAMVAAGRAPESERPGLIAAETTIMTAVVHEINQEAGTFKLKWQDGVEEYVARDPENLKRAEVGDMVVVTVTDALALQLQEVTTE